MSRVDKEPSTVISEDDVQQTGERPSVEMQHCLDEVVAVLRKYEVGVTLCLASDRESVLLYRIPEWCAVSLSDNGPEINTDQLWQTDDLEKLMFRSYQMSTALREMNERMHTESTRLDEFVRNLGQHLLDPDRKAH
ncbi:MAG: hypothetical protein KDJ22_06790 [Candidatus Competibacteraceae bacterium]|nr:hypothetical protein [Candidatus Competibacteraceae bacterium]MCP5126376.1 hypothetical protein [Gammaproteobacteria bacterium]HRX70386.1 hypothetical protein [Candidatus Competibacteraceae bacterium]